MQQPGRSALSQWAIIRRYCRCWLRKTKPLQSGRLTSRSLRTLPNRSRDCASRRKIQDHQTAASNHGSQCDAGKSLFRTATQEGEAGMSSQVYTLISPTFRQLEKPNEDLCEKHTDFLRYFLHRLISCRHRQLSRPFTHDGRTYRSCASCGMRREFDLATWQSKGRYYQAEASKADMLQ